MMISNCTRSLFFAITKNLFIFSFLFAISLIPLCSGASPNIQIATPNGLDENVLSNEEKTGDQMIQNLEAAVTNPAVSRSMTIQDLPKDIRIIIASYLENPVTTLGSIDLSYYYLFHNEYNLKYYLNEMFGIPEFRCVDENEPEIAGILNLSWCRNGDPLLLFGSLLEDLSSGKKPFKALLPPLISYLRRIDRELSSDPQRKYEFYCINRLGSQFPTLIGNICAKNGHLDLAFEILDLIPQYLTKVLGKIENRKQLMDTFKENYHLAMQHKDNLLEFDITESYHLKSVLEWIGECIIYDAPEEYYTDILADKPITLMKLIECDWFLSLDIPESEYPRVHAQIRKLADSYLNRNKFNFSYLVNDVRFGSVDMEQINFSTSDKERLVIISKAALFGNKFDLFKEIVNRYYIYHFFIDSIIKMMDVHGLKLYENSIKAIFELIAVNPKCFRSDNYIKFIMKFYALNHLKAEDDKIYFEFVSPKGSPLPSSIIIERNFSDFFLLVLYFPILQSKFFRS